MNARIKLFISLFLLFSYHGLFALEITKEAEAYIKGEYNRGNYNNGEVQLLGNIGLNELVNFKLGFSYLQNTASPEFNVLFKTGFSPFNNQYLSPLSFSVSYLLNTIVEYDVTTHSIFPSVSYKTERFGAEIGVSLRLTSFFGESPQFESILSFYIYCNFIKTNALTIGAGCGTFDDFNARNMGALWLDLNVDVRISKNLTIMNEFVWLQSGLDGFSAVFYGISYKGGVKFSW
ncbi:MAG: hypothetical protein FWC12_08785 [Treponema sp.]|nr:hypothetical protein [Treponema sp.]